MKIYRRERKKKAIRKEKDEEYKEVFRVKFIGQIFFRIKKSEKTYTYIKKGFDCLLKIELKMNSFSISHILR